MLRVLLATTLTASSLPRLQEGLVPSAPVSGREGGVAILEVHVSAAGSVTDTVELGGVALIAKLMREHVADWRFEPARNETGEPVPSTVLVAVVNRAPAMVGSIPPLPKTPRPTEASSELPFPERIAMPALPPQAGLPGVVLLEVAVGKDGEVASAEVVRSSDGFDGVALDTIEGWKFGPATRNGAAVTARAYVLFSFRPPPRLQQRPPRTPREPLPGARNRSFSGPPGALPGRYARIERTVSAALPG
jgi:TonB family protein